MSVINIISTVLSNVIVRTNIFFTNIKTKFVVFLDSKWRDECIDHNDVYYLFCLCTP